MVPTSPAHATCALALGRANLPLDQKSTANKILRALSAADVTRLAPHLTEVDLPVRRQLEVRNRDIDYVYFLERGLASIVASVGSSHSVEVGVIGHEGVTGLALILENDRAQHECFIQSAGAGWRLPAGELRRAMADSATLRTTLIHYVNTVLCQMAFTALSNARYGIEERLARWLLMAHDRAQSDELPLTHEFLSLMLGTRRAGVTTALNIFEGKGFITARRGMVIVRDRQALDEVANGSYGPPEDEYRRLIGQPLRAGTA